MQALKSQYESSKGYYIRKPKAFKFQDRGDAVDRYLSIIVVEDDMDNYCVIAADKRNKQVKFMHAHCMLKFIAIIIR